MKLLIFGASGKTGQVLVAKALAQDHTVTAFVRSAGKLAIRHALLTTVEGNVVDPAAVNKVVPGHDVVLICLGVGTPLKPDPAVVSGISNIVTAMEITGPSRLIYLSFLGVSDGRAQLGLLLGRIIAPLVLRHEVADHEKKERLIAASSLDWTIVRPPKLVGGDPTGRYRHGTGIRATSLLPTLRRTDLADFMLGQTVDQTYARKAVAIFGSSA